MIKFFPSNQAHAVECPPVRGWFVAFACGFLTICIVGPVLCFGMWLIGLAATALKLTSIAAVFAVSVPVAARIILLMAMAFGALLATVALFESVRRKRQKVHVPGHNPIIGDFEQLPYSKTWHAKPMLPTGHTVHLDGQGSSPSDSQTALWQKFIARYDELSSTVTRALLTQPHPFQECSAVTLTPNGITIAQDGHLHVELHATPPRDYCPAETEEPLPFAVLTPALELEKTQWIAPYAV